MFYDLTYIRYGRILQKSLGNLSFLIRELYTKNIRKKGYLNLIPWDGSDGMHILSGMIGCSDLYEYAVDMLTNQRKRRKLLASGINGWVTLVCSLVIILFQVASPALFVMNIVLFIF